MRASRLRAALADLEIPDCVFVARAGVSMAALTELRRGRTPQEHNLAAMEQTHELLKREGLDVFSTKARRLAEIAERAEARYGS